MQTPTRRRVLVTGATSGIGHALALHLARSGFSVALHGRRIAVLEELAAQAQLVGAETALVVCDVADRAGTDRALEEFSRRWPRLHGVVLNAGISEHVEIDAPDTRTFDQILEIDLIAPIRMTRALLPAIENDGRVIAIGSVLGRFGVPRGHGYCAAKAGLSGFIRALALEVAPRRITANAVLPGWVETPMADRAIEREAALRGILPMDAKRAFEAAVPLGRFLDPDEVASVVTFLIGRGGNGITGQCLNVCGGVLA